MSWLFEFRYVFGKIIWVRNKWPAFCIFKYSSNLRVSNMIPGILVQLASGDRPFAWAFVADAACYIDRAIVCCLPSPSALSAPILRLHHICRMQKTVWFSHTLAIMPKQSTCAWTWIFATRTVEEGVDTINSAEANPNMGHVCLLLGSCMAGPRPVKHTSISF